MRTGVVMLIRVLIGAVALASVTTSLSAGPRPLAEESEAAGNVVLTTDAWQLRAIPLSSGAIVPVSKVVHPAAVASQLSNWTSSNPEVVQIRGQEIVTGSAGVAYLTVERGDEEATVELVVTAASFHSRQE